MPDPPAFDLQTASPAFRRRRGKGEKRADEKALFGKGTENVMDLKGKRIVCGAKSVKKALEREGVSSLWLARDASEEVVAPLRELAEKRSVPVDETRTMRELGKAASIEIGSAAVALLK